VLGSSDAHSISVSADGRRLAYAKFLVAQNIWSLPIPQAGVASIEDAMPVTSDNHVIEEHALSPDGRWIAFDSDIRGESDIYRMPVEGGDWQTVVDFNGDAWRPRWSPDGSEIAFYSAGDGTLGGTEVFVVAADGSTEPEQLSEGPGRDGQPDWSPDGLSIVYHSEGPSGVPPSKIWIVSRERIGAPWSEPVQLTEFPCMRANWARASPAFVCDAGGAFALVSIDGDLLARVALPAGVVSGVQPVLSPDGSRIYFTGTHEDRSRGIWWIPANGGDATKVVATSDPSLFMSGYITVSDEYLYFTVASYESDIWVVDLEW
jgi:TolB protein